MPAQRMKRSVLTLAIVAVAVLVGALLGRAQSVFPVRFDDSSEAAITTPPSWAQMDGLRYVPQDRPPVRCNATNLGFFYFQRDAVGFTPVDQVGGAPCICLQCNGSGNCPGTEGYTDPGFLWNNTSAQLCKNLWVPDSP